MDKFQMAVIRLAIKCFLTGMSLGWATAWIIAVGITTDLILPLAIYLFLMGVSLLI